MDTHTGRCPNYPSIAGKHCQPRSSSRGSVHQPPAMDCASSYFFSSVHLYSTCSSLPAARAGGSSLPVAPCRRQLLAAPCRRQLLVHSPPPRRPRGGGAQRRGGAGGGRAFAEPETKRTLPAVPCAASTKRKRPAAGRSHCALARRRRAEEEVHSRLCQTRHRTQRKIPAAGRSRHAPPSRRRRGRGRPCRAPPGRRSRYAAIYAKQEAHL